MIDKLMKAIGRKFVPWDPWSVREIRSEAHELGYKQGFRQGLKAGKKEQCKCACQKAKETNGEA